MQIAVDVDSRIVVAARTSNSGGDMGQVEATVAEIERRTDNKPADYLIDRGFAKRETIDTLTKDDIRVLAPTMKPGKQRDSRRLQGSSRH